MSPTETPRVALLTPPGRGGIAVLRVRDSARVRSLFQGAWPEPGAIAYGRFGDIDEGLLVDLGDAIEISVHGSPAVVDRLIALLGEPEAPWEGEDRVRREAHELLARATTLLAARVLADQAMGALSRAILDGVDVLSTARLGIALAESPPVVAFVGRPNSGKSTLFNALVGRYRAVVASDPGTTRDPVRELVSFDGIPVRLVDTAGLGVPKDALDEEAQRRTAREQERADLVVHVREPDETPRGLSIVSKCDVRPGDVSGVTGQGLEELRRAILSELRIPAPPPPGSPVVFTRRQRDLLKRGASANEVLGG